MSGTKPTFKGKSATFVKRSRKRSTLSSPSHMRTRSKTHLIEYKKKEISRGPKKSRKRRKITTTITTCVQTRLFACEYCGRYTMGSESESVCNECKEAIKKKTYNHLYAVIADVVVGYL